MYHFQKAGRVLGLTAVPLWLASCASVMSGTDQAMTVITEPAGAACEMTRDGETIAHVNPTPGSITVEKGWDDITVTCRKDDYEETAMTVASTHDAWGSAGNILVWGIFFPVAMAVDAGSGAMNEYPPTVVIRLIQRHFATAEERNRFYDGAKSTVTNTAAAKIAEVQENCKKEDGCAADAKKLEAARDAELASLEEKRLRAIINSGAAAAPSTPATTPGSAPATAPVVTAPTDTTAYATERLGIERKWDARLAMVRQVHCQDGDTPSQSCDDAVKPAEAQRDAELAALDQKYGVTASN